ncbi:MAG: hypothetical protein RBG13Loki_0919 [Promethearchaeota archaeon CR_4]|nr:MAG: hypothetical protein RBG13Loki_0919 [Candidatus Lokiarchaeota archaeon CR_4]
MHVIVDILDFDIPCLIREKCDIVPRAILHRHREIIITQIRVREAALATLASFLHVLFRGQVRTRVQPHERTIHWKIVLVRH